MLQQLKRHMMPSNLSYIIEAHRKVHLSVLNSEDFEKDFESKVRQICLRILNENFKKLFFQIRETHSVFQQR